MALAGSDHFVANFNAVQALSRSIDRVFEEAQLSGVLSLNGRNLKEFPSAAERYDLTDTVVADLAKNRLTEFPVQLCEYGSLETLILYHNCIRSIPLAVQFLASLTYLDLSRNQLVTIPSALTLLPLEVLILNNNRIQAIPNDVRRLAGSLMELDVSCNRLTSLPLDVGELTKLRVLNARENLLSELPLTLNKLQLRTLDVSSNKLSFLDVGIRYMTSLIEFYVEDNPLVFPPAKLCDRGCVHIFKALELESMRRTKRRPQTSNSVESDVLERRRFRMTAAAAAVANGNANSVKLVPTNPADYKYSMTLSAVEQRRKHRHHTIASESRFSNSVDDCLNPWNTSPNERSIDCATSTIGAPLQKRSPPVGEEVPPPPPSKVETTPLTSRPKVYPSTCATRSIKAEPVVNGASFVDEVMAACREHIENGSEVGARNGGGSYGETETDGDQISTILRRKKEQEMARKRNMAEYLQHVQHENESSINTNGIGLKETSTHPVFFTASTYTCESSAFGRVSSQPIERQVKRTTYSIKEESDASPNHGVVAGPSMLPISPNLRTDERTVKTPPKSARSDVIQSLYTSPSGAASTNIKKLTPNQSDHSDVHPCCHVHGNASTSPSPHEARQNGNGVSNGCSHADEVEIVNGKSTNGDAYQSKLAAPPPSSARDARQGQQPSQQGATVEQTTTGGSKASINGRTDSLRRSSGSSSEAKAQKKSVATNGTIRMSTSSQAIKNGASCQQQGSMTTSTSAQRLSSASNSRSTTTAVTNGAVGALAVSASKKYSPPSVVPQDQAKNSVASKAGAVQKDNVGPVFHRATLSANQTRASRSRESLVNGIPSGSLSRKSDTSERQQQLVEDMRQVLEKTLKITLPSSVSDLAETLSDGVYLCHFVNAVRPRTIPSVHTPSDPTMKLPVAKCRRNVENFLMGCRRLGIAESQLFNVSDVADKKTLANVAKSMQALAKQAMAPNGLKTPSPSSTNSKITNV